MRGAPEAINRANFRESPAEGVLVRLKFMFCLAAVLLIASPCFPAGFTENDLKDRQRHGDYEARVYRGEDGFGQFKIFRKGREVYSRDGFCFKIGLMDEQSTRRDLVRMGNDITGDGEPDLLVSEWTGGAHRRYIFYLFQIGKEFKELEIIENDDGCEGYFEDIDGDGSMEFIGKDYVFSDWHASFACSPFPRVILKCHRGKYRLALGLMTTPLPAKDKEQEVLAEIKERQERLAAAQASASDAWIYNDVVLPSEVWGYMLDLIYSGHPREAWLFLDKVWPQGAPGKEEFIKDFKKQLSMSYYWDSIKHPVSWTFP